MPQASSKDQVPVVIANEEGRIHNLPVNEKASDLAGVLLVGDVIHLTPQEWKAMENEGNEAKDDEQD